MLAAGATIDDVSGGFGVGTGPDFPEVRAQCRITLPDGREFEHGGETYDEAEAAAMARAEAALGLS